MVKVKRALISVSDKRGIKEFAAGKVEFRNDSGGNIHAVVGKLSFDDTKLTENADVFIQHIKKMQPAAIKGVYIKKVCLTATMSPAVLLDVV